MVGDDRGIEDRADPAVGDCLGPEVLGGGRAVGAGTWEVIRDQLEETLVASPHGVEHLEVHEVPMDVPRIHLGADFGEAAVVVLPGESHPGGCLERLVMRLGDRPRVGPAPRNHRQGLGREIAAAPSRCQRQGRADGRRPAARLPAAHGSEDSGS